MSKTLSLNYSLLEYFNLPYPTPTKKKENSKLEIVKELKPIPKPQHIEIQLSLLDEVNL